MQETMYTKGKIIRSVVTGLFTFVALLITSFIVCRIAAIPLPSSLGDWLLNLGCYALLASIAAIYNTAIAAKVSQFLKERIFTKATYFRAAILICMVVSVAHGAHLFATSNNNNLLQLSLAGTIDVGTWVLIEALIALRKRGLMFASLLVLCGIVALCGISYAANLVYNEHFQDVPQFVHVDTWFIGFIPYIQSCPPLIIAFMSTVAEVFVKPDTDNDTATTFKERIKAVYARRVDTLEAKLEARARLQELKSKYKPIALQQVKWSFFGFKLYYPVTVDTELVKKQERQIEDLHGVIEELKQLTSTQDTKIHNLNLELQESASSIEDKQREMETLRQQIQENATEIERLRVLSLPKVETEKTTDTSLHIPISTNGHLSVYRRKKDV